MNDTAEIRNFEMHQNLLLDVIERQAGTLDKAVLEGAMNLIEAGATMGRITLDLDRLIIADDGKGFATRDEVLAAFEVFGKSDERKLEEKRFARFQIGRGQLFAAGRTTYRTRTFQMVADVRNDGLKYTLVEDLDDFLGCTVTVELRDKLTEFDRRKCAEAVARNIRYVDVPIYLNGEKVTRDPATEKWDLETEDAYYRFNENKHTIAIFNRGVYVQDKYVGVGGVVVSKRQLDVNFARNDVLDSCPVWRAIRANFRDKTEKTLLQKRTFTPEDVWTVLANVADGQYQPHDVSGLPLFRTANDKRYSFDRISRCGMLSFSERNSKKAARVMREQNVVVLDRTFVAAALNLDGAKDMKLHAALRQYAASILTYRTGKFPTFVPEEELYASVSDDVEYISDAKLTKPERHALRLLDTCVSRALLTSAYEGDQGIGQRRLALANTEKAPWWTDGRSSIGFERGWFADRITSLAGWTEILLAMCEQYTFTSADGFTGDAYNERFRRAVGEFLKPLGPIFRTHMVWRAKEGFKVPFKSERDALALDAGADLDDAVEIEADASPVDPEPEDDAA